MQEIDQCRARWMALGSPQHEVPRITELTSDVLHLQIVGGMAIRPVVYEFAIDDDVMLAAFHAIEATDLERGWLREMMSLMIEDRASIMAAAEGFWEPKTGTAAYEYRLSAAA